MKRTLSLILAILMSLSLLPGLAFADDETDPALSDDPTIVEASEAEVDFPEAPSDPADAEPEDEPEAELLPEETPVQPEESEAPAESFEAEPAAETEAAEPANATVVPSSDEETSDATESSETAPAQETGEAALPTTEEEPAAAEPSTETPQETEVPTESPEPSATPEPSPSPAPETSSYSLNTPAVKTASNNDSGIKITWGKVSGAAKYRVFRKVGDGAWKKVGDTKKTTLTDTKVKAGVTYTYTVRCISSNGKKYTSDFDPDGLTITRFAAVKLSKASATTEGVKVTWKKLSGAQGYAVYRKTSGGSWKKIGTVEGGDTRSYTDASAKSGKTYYYTVSAMDAGGNPGLHNNTGVSIKFIAAPVVSSLANVQDGVTVKWGKVSGAEKYRVFRKVDGGSWKKLGDTTSASFTDTKAKAGVTYTYTVRCISSSGSSYTSAYLPGDSILVVPTPAVAGLRAVENGMEFTWSPVSGAEEYIVCRKASGGSWKKIATVGADVTSYIDEAAPTGKVCAYTVRAVRDGTKSGFDKLGALPAGWIEFGNTTYKINEDGTKVTGWVKKDGRKYYFKENGVMATGAQIIDGEHYYFYKKDDKNGGPWGAMATNKTIGNWKYKANGKGVSVFKVNMINKAQNYSSSTSWLILVDLTHCVFGVFKGSYGNWDLKYYWDCSPGKSTTPTVIGSFTVQGKGYSFSVDGAYCYYYTKFYGNYLIHSTLYNYDGSVRDSRLGMNLSHGCVRLLTANAKWVYDNIPLGTKVVTYYG